MFAPDLSDQICPPQRGNPRLLPGETFTGAVVRRNASVATLEGTREEAGEPALRLALDPSVIVVPVLGIGFVHSQLSEEEKHEAKRLVVRQIQSLFDYAPTDDVRRNTPPSRPICEEHDGIRTCHYPLVRPIWDPLAGYPSWYADPAGVTATTSPRVGSPVALFDEKFPDDVWTECNIQFQLVATMTMEFDHEFCSTSQADRVLASDAAVEAEIRNQFGDRADALLALDPIWAEFGPFDCFFGSPGFAGTTDTSAQVVQVTTLDHTPSKCVTAHELGHALLMDPNHLNDPSRLMYGGGNQRECGTVNSTPGAECTGSYCDSCNLARGHAEALASRWATFNYAMGSTKVEPPAPPVATPQPANVCCRFEDSVSYMLDIECNNLGGTQWSDYCANFSEPAMCCAAADGMSATLATMCDTAEYSTTLGPQANPVDVDECQVVCCLTPNGQSDMMKRFDCAALGGGESSDGAACSVIR